MQYIFLLKQQVLQRKLAAYSKQHHPLVLAILISTLHLQSNDENIPVQNSHHNPIITDPKGHLQLGLISVEAKLIVAPVVASFGVLTTSELPWVM